MNNTIEIDTKIDNTGIQKGANSVIKSLGKIYNSLSKTGEEMANAFSGKTVAQLTSQIEKQHSELVKSEEKVKSLKTELENLQNAEPTTEKYKELNDEFNRYVDEIERAEERMRKLQDIVDDFASRGIVDPEGSIAGMGEEYHELRQVTTEMETLRANILTTGEVADDLANKMEKIRITPATATKIEKLKNSITETEGDTERLKNEIEKTDKAIERAFGAENASNIEKIKEGINDTKNEGKKATNVIEKFGKRISRLVTAVFVFNVIRKGLSELQKYMTGLMSTNDELTNSLNQIKVGLITAFQPIYEAILPALNALMSALAQAVTYLSAFINMLFGKTVDQSKKSAEAMNKQAEAIKNVGKASKDAGKSMASFDKANKLSSSAGGGAGGGGLSDLIGDTKLPDIDTSIFDKVKDKMNEMLGWFVSTFKPSWVKFWKGLEPNLLGFKDNVGRLFRGLQPIWGDFLKFINDEWLPAFIEVIDIAGRIYNGLFDSYNLVFGDIIDVILLPFAETLVNEIMPLITEFSLELWRTVETLFNEIKTIFDEVWTTGIVPILELVMYLFEQVFLSLAEFWENWGEPIFANIREAVEKTGAIIMKLWEKFVKPVVEMITEVVKELWDESLKPLLDNILDMIGELINGALEIYNKFVAPIVNWLIDILGPIFTLIFGRILGTVKSVFGTIADIFNSFVTIIKGIIQFITGVFTGDWKKAWEGVKNVFSGIMSGLANILKSPLNTIIGGINGFIKGINKIKIPDWVPGVGGKGFSLKELPRLARGAVIPPNKEFLAVLGDQTSGTNIETPEGLLRQVVREETGSSSTDKNTIIKVYIGDEEIYSRFEEYQDDKKFATNGGR